MTNADLAVVLVRTQQEGNLGAVARAMANMGLEHLLLVEPRVGIGDTARAFAVGAGHVLDGAVVAASLTEALAPFQRVVGTTSNRGRHRAPQTIEARQLPEALAADPRATKTALVFGPESSGLTVDEMAMCSLLVSIPCAPEQPTLNLSQAVLVVAYELFIADLGSRSNHEREPAATATQIDGLIAQAETALREVGFARDDTFEGVLRDLRRLAARASPTDREVRILRGIVRRTRGKIAAEDPNRPQDR